MGLVRCRLRLVWLAFTVCVWWCAFLISPNQDSSLGRVSCETQAADDIWRHTLNAASIRNSQSTGAGNQIVGSQKGDRMSEFDSRLQDNNRSESKTTATKTNNKDTSEPAEKTARLAADVCNFGGSTVRVAVSIQPPLVNCLQDSYGDWLCNGSNIELIRVLERRLNFSAHWIVLANTHLDNEVSDMHSEPQRAQPLNEGDHNHQHHRNRQDDTSPLPPGIFGLVSSGRALMSANGVMQTMDRARFNLIVSKPFDSFRLHFLLSKSVRDHDHLFVKPFNWNAWLAILLSAALIVPIFYFLNSTSAHYSLQDDRELAKVSLATCFLHYNSKIFSKLASSLRRLLVGAMPCLLTNATGRWRLRRRWRLWRRKQPRTTTPTAGTIISLCRNPSASSSCSTSLSSERCGGDSSSLDAKISQLVASGEYLDLRATFLVPIRGETRRQRRLLRRQWALERRRALRCGRRQRKSGFFKLAYVAWYVIASLANQGGETEDLPHASSTRILIAFWWLFLIVICAIHSGILTAILTFPKQADFIQTLDDYLGLEHGERASIKLAADKYSELAHLLADANNLHKSPLQVLMRHSIPVEFVDFQRHRQRILDDIQRGESALIEETSTITQVISQDYFDSSPLSAPSSRKCLFKQSRYPLDVVPMSLVLSKQMAGHCVRALNSIMKKVRQTGLAQKWRRKYEAPGNDCLNSVIINAGDVAKIELKHVMLAFWLLLTGLIAGLLVMLAEIAWLLIFDDEEDDDEKEAQHARQVVPGGAVNFPPQAQHSSASSPSSSSSPFSSSGSSSDNDDELDGPQLGYKRAVVPREIRTVWTLSQQRLKGKTILRRAQKGKKLNGISIKSRQPARIRVPKITFSVESNGEKEANKTSDSSSCNSANSSSSSEDQTNLQVVTSNLTARRNERKKRRAAQLARRRARRWQKAVDFFKRIHEGNIYSHGRQLSGRVRRVGQGVMRRLSRPALVGVAPTSGLQR